MRCLALLSLLLVLPAIYGQATKTRRGPRPPNFRPPPLPAVAARQHPAVLTQRNVVPPPAARGRNDVKDVPDNFRAGPPPAPAPVPPPAAGYIPPAAPASRRRPPSYRTFQAPPPAAAVPPTRTRSVGMLRPLPPQPMYDQYVPYVPPVMPPTTQPYDWGAHHDVNKEEEES